MPPSLQHSSPLGSNAFELGQLLRHSPSPYGHPPSPGVAPKSAINPIFKVVSYKWDSEGGFEPDDSGDFVQPPLFPPRTSDSSAALPPFSQLEAIAGGEYPAPLSRIGFSTSEDS